MAGGRGVAFLVLLNKEAWKKLDKSLYSLALGGGGMLPTAQWAGAKVSRKLGFKRDKTVRPSVIWAREVVPLYTPGGPHFASSLCIPAD